MHDSKPQRCVYQHKLLKMTQNALNRDKHMKEALKQILPNKLFKVSCNLTQGMFSNQKFVSMSSKYELMTKNCVIWVKLTKN